MKFAKNLKKKLLPAYISGTLLVSSVPFIAVKTVHAEEEYLIRDKWGYCTTANYVESEHFVIFYGNNDTTGQVTPEFLKRNLDDYEKLWHCYTEYLGMTDLNVDIYGKSPQKYKTNVYLTYTGLDQYPDGWAFMSAEDGYGIEIISPEAMLDDLTIAHEFGHVTTMQQKAWVDQDITGAWWECTANWFREMYIGSEYYTGNVKTCWFEPYIRNMSLNIPHGRNYYEIFPFLLYMSYNPDNIEGLGVNTMHRLMSEALPNEYPLDTVARLFGVSAQDVLGNYAKRMATFDFGPQEAYQSEFYNKLNEAPFYWNLFYTVPEAAENGWLRVPEEEAPMQTGINIIPLNVTGDTISVDFKGLSNDKNAGWRACIVTVDGNGNESYSRLFNDGESVSVPAKVAVSAYITVVGTPDELYPCNAFHKQDTAPYKTSPERRRFPYEIKVEGAEVQQQAPYRADVGHNHVNGGGFVADSANVAESVYVAPGAKVLGNAVLSGNVRVEDKAIVANNVTAKDNVVISGHAIVDGGGWVYDNGWQMGTVTLGGNVIISDSAVVFNSCKISGNAKILQKAYVSDAVTVSENAVVKGNSYLYGKGNYSGQVILDGDYSNDETLTGGTAFGWLDTAGKDYTDGMICGYEFADNTDTWSYDKHGATNALQKGAYWQDERTSARGVMNFDGKDDYMIIDDSAVRSDNLQISLAALWTGGSKQQLFRFGDDSAYMSFTPENSDGKAEFTITDGNTTETLTAPTALAKGEWTKLTIRLIDGNGELLINGVPVDSKSISVTPLNVMSAVETDRCCLGGSGTESSFKGAVDYCNFYFKAVDEPITAYFGREPVDEKIMGDVNADGVFDIADAVALQRWLVGKDETLADWKAGDFIDDDKLNVFDLCAMKHSLLGL